MSDEFGVVLLDELMDFLGLAPSQLSQSPAEILDVDDNLHKVQLSGTGAFQVRIFTVSNISSEGLEWPIEGATEINVVI